MGRAVSSYDPAEEGALGEFEGTPITEVGVEKVDNIVSALHRSFRSYQTIRRQGDTVYAILRIDVTRVGFKPVQNDEGNSMRVHTLRVTDATLVEPSYAVDHIDAQRARDLQLYDEERGQERLMEDERL